MAGSSVHLGLLGPARRAGPPPLRSARKRRRGQGDVPPARGPPPSATGRYGPRGVFTHRAGARCAWGDVPPGSRPASTCNRALRPAWRLRSSSRCPQHLGGRAPPDRGPPLPATEHYGSRGAFTLQSWCSHRLGERLPPARGLHLLATGHYGPCGIFTHQAGRSAPPTAARPRSSSLVVVTRRSRLATSRDHLRERPLPVTPSLSSRWTSRREEEGRGDVISPFPTRVAGRWSWPLSPSHLLNNPSGLKQVSVE